MSEAHQSQDGCFVTVAICTWNRSRLLAQTLDGLTKMAVPADLTWELLVLDNNSGDNTRSVALGYRHRLPVRYVLEPTLGLCSARNRAIQESLGEYVAFIDDDVLVDEQWLSSLARAARRHPQAAALGGPIEPWWVAEPDPLLAEIFPKLKMGFCAVSYDQGEGLLPTDLQIYGANMVFNKEAIGPLRFNLRLGQKGNNETRSDEIEFLSRLRANEGAVMWVPDLRVRHYVDPARMRLPYLRRLTVGEGRADVRLKGVPLGTRVCGAPRWIVRRCLELRFRAVLSWTLGQRRRALLALRDHDYLRGVIRESCLMWREQRFERAS